MATLIGESTFSGTNGSHFRARIYLDSYTQSIENNSTTAVRHLYMQSFDGYSGYGATITGYIDGVPTGSTSSIGKNSIVDMGTSTITVTHNNEGVGSVSFNSSINASAWGLGTANIYASWTPPSIARSAKITAPSNAAIEETIKLNINRLVDTYNYTLRYKFTGDTQDYEGTIVENINQDSYEWTVPEIFYQYWTKGTNKFCTIYCDTYNGNSLIGTKSTNIQILVNTNTKPDITNYNFRDMNSKTVALTDDNGKMVQGYSVGRLSFTATLNYYSKVDRVVDGDGNPVDYEIVSNTEQKQVILIEKDYTDFSVVQQIWVWDGRGMVGIIGLRTQNMATFPPAVKTIVYERVDYIPLTLSMTAKRPSATTGEIAVAFSGNYFNANFGAVDNTLELSWKYRQKGVETWTNGGTFVKDTDYEITGNVYESKGNVSLGNIFDYRNIYEIAIYYKDKLIDTYTTKIVTRGLPIFWWNKDGVYDGNNKKFLVEGEASGGDTLPIGAMLPYGNTTPPENWLICDGSEVSRTTYAELFNVIGTSYGSGDGSTTFNLPNKKGRTSVGLDSSQTEFNTIGKRDGEKTHQLKVEEMPSHDHSLTPLVDIRQGDGQTNANSGSLGTHLGGYVSKPNTAVSLTGGNQPHNNLQPYEVDQWIIKAFKTTNTPITSEVTNTYSESENNVYSCNYINSHNLKPSIIHQVTPTVGSNYEHYGNTYYYKVGSRVHVHVGISIDTQTYTTIFTLPVGFRPKTMLGFVANGSSLDNFAGLQITPDGTITTIAKNGYVLADMEFDTFES